MAGVIVFWIICGSVAAVITSSRGGSGVVGFLVGLVFGPLGIIAAFFLGNESAKATKEVETGAAKKCPECAELVKPEAKVCRFCGHRFSEMGASA